MNETTRTPEELLLESQSDESAKLEERTALEAALRDPSPLPGEAPWRTRTPQEEQDDEARAESGKAREERVAKYAEAVAVDKRRAAGEARKARIARLLSDAKKNSTTRPIGTRDVQPIGTRDPQPIGIKDSNWLPLQRVIQNYDDDK